MLSGVGWVFSKLTFWLAVWKKWTLMSGMNSFICANWLCCLLTFCKFNSRKTIYSEKLHFFFPPFVCLFLCLRFMRRNGIESENWWRENLTLKIPSRVSLIVVQHHQTFFYFTLHICGVVSWCQCILLIPNFVLFIYLLLKLQNALISSWTLASFYKSHEKSTLFI